MPLDITSSLSKLNARLKFCQSGSNPAFTNSELTDFIDQAVEEYARYKPNQTQLTLQLVKDQAVYNWPVQAKALTGFLYSLDEQSSLVNYYFGDYYNLVSVNRYFDLYYESPALQARSQAYFSRFKQNTLGRLNIDEGNRSLTLDRPPTQNMTVMLPCEIVYAKTGTAPNETYADIPSEHSKYIVNVAQAIALRALALGYSVNNEKIGDRDVRGKDMANQMFEEAERLEQEFHDYFYRPAVARS